MTWPDSAGLLTYARSVLTAALPGTGTIARTGITVAAMVDEDTREVSLPGGPAWLRVRRWTLVFPDGTDIQTGDRVTVPGKGTYLLTDILNPQDYSVAANAFALRFIATGTASTSRPSGQPWTSVTVPVSAAQEIAALALHSFTPELLTAITPQFMLDEFGVQAVQPAWVIADIPAGHIERYPVQPGDLVTITPTTYVCIQVQPFPNGLILFLDVPAAT